jgi:hypothetical protein
MRVKQPWDVPIMESVDSPTSQAVLRIDFNRLNG